VYRALGERYRAVAESRRHVSTSSALAQAQGLQGLADALQPLCHTGTRRACQDAAQVADVCWQADDEASKLVSDFAVHQREVRACVSSQAEGQALAAKLSNRDSARANMCRGLRDKLAAIVECVCGEKKSPVEGRQVEKRDRLEALVVRRPVT
jgi:hypothetical protein